MGNRVNGKAYWDKHGRAFAELYERPTLFNRTFRKSLYLRTRLAVDEIALTPGASVLDVGCGSGRNSLLFIKQAGAAQVVGVDLSEQMLSLAHKLVAVYEEASRCRFVLGDFLNTDPGGGPFDYSVALGVMDYFRKPLPMLRRMREMTRTAAIASFPGFAPVRTTLRKIRYGLRGQGVYWFWKNEVRQLMLEAGFQEVSVIRCTRAGWIAIGKP